MLEILNKKLDRVIELKEYNNLYLLDWVSEKINQVLLGEKDYAIDYVSEELSELEDYYLRRRKYYYDLPISVSVRLSSTIPLFTARLQHKQYLVSSLRFTQALLEVQNETIAVILITLALEDGTEFIDLFYSNTRNAIDIAYANMTKLKQLRD